MSRSKDFALEPIWKPLLLDMGIQPADVLRRAQLPAHLFAYAGGRLGSEEYFRLWHAVEQEARDPLFPLRLIEVLTTELFLPPLFAALCSSNLRVAVERIGRYKRLVGPMALEGRVRNGVFVVTLRWLYRALQPPASLAAAELAFLVKLARVATRANVRPVRVVAVQPPTPSDAYERFFGARVERGETHTLAFQLSDAERPFLTANERMWQVFEPELRRRLAELDDAATAAERVRAALLEGLPSGQASMAAIAERLAVSTRTLQRRLRGEGTSFQAVLNNTREALARHYLLRTSMSCAEIAFLLGFEDPNSFFRAFQNWTGNTPEGVRSSGPLSHRARAAQYSAFLP